MAAPGGRSIRTGSVRLSSELTGTETLGNGIDGPDKDLQRGSSRRAAASGPIAARDRHQAEDAKGSPSELFANC
jgi:hypothetical protein